MTLHMAGDGAYVELQPLKIHFHYELSRSTTQEDQDYLRHRLLPATAAVLRQFVGVRRPPAAGVLRLTPPCEDGWKVCTHDSCKTSCKKWAEQKCGNVSLPSQHLDALETCDASVSGVAEVMTGSQCATAPAGTGVIADLIIYVTNENRCQGDNLASSLFCASDTLTNRPVAGAIDFCKFGRGRFQDDLMVSVHETIHILGMSSMFFNISGHLNGESKFVNKDLKPIKMSDVVESYTSAAGRTKFRVITPAVKAAARRHFGCPTLRGAPLADDSGNGSAGSHWDQRLFEGDIMVPVVGEDTVVGRHVITNVTLAMLEDTGWYVVNYRASGFNHWGYMGGCEFAERSAKEVSASEHSSVQRFTCRRAHTVSTQCTVDLTSLGVCIADASIDGLTHVKEDSENHTCLRSEAVSFTDTEAAYGQYHGPGSRCILQSPGFSRKGFDIGSSSMSSAGCYKTFCMGEEGNRQLYIEFEGPGVQVLCPPGSFLDLSKIPGLDFTGGSLLGPCPDREVMCGWGEREEGMRECGNSDCSANGDCLRGRCHCDIGYAGTACDSRVCTDDQSCEKGKICHWSGLCLSAEEARNFQFQFAAIAPTRDPQYSPAAPSEGLSDAWKLGIILSMGALLLVIAVICAWLLLRNKKVSRYGARATSGTLAGTDRAGAHSALSSSTLQMTASGFTPSSMGGPTPPRSGSSQKNSAISGRAQNINDTPTHASMSGGWPVYRSGCPMSM